MARQDFNKYLNIEENDNENNKSSFMELASPQFDISMPFRKNSDNITIQEISVQDLIPFQGETPFYDYTKTDKFQSLVRDIDDNGIITPITVRELTNGHYEILAGYHRSQAAKYLHHATVPAYVYPVDMTDDKAMLVHLNTNLLNGRDTLSFYETVKAMIAYDSTLENLRGQRTDRQDNGEKFDRYLQLAEVFKIGNKTTAVQYLKAGKELPDDILHMVDKGQIAFIVAYKMLQQKADFREELFDYCRQGNKLTASKLDQLIEANKAKILETEKFVMEQEVKEHKQIAKAIPADMGFQSASEYDHTHIPKSDAPLTEGTVVQMSEEKAPDTIDKKPLNGTLTSNEFDHVLKERKKHQYITMKIDKDVLPKKFTELSEDKKQELIITLLRRWENEA